MASFIFQIPKLLTSKELKVLEKRYKIVNLLKTDLTYRQIAKQMGISTTTVVRLNQRLKIRKRKSLKKTKKDYSFSGPIGPKNEYIRPKSKKLPWVIG